MSLHDSPLTETPLAALAPYAHHTLPRPRLTPRDVAATLLRAASRALDRLALRLAQPASAAAPDTDVEFYAEAGAPEGAVYVNGRLLGVLPGVNRL